MLLRSSFASKAVLCLCTVATAVATFTPEDLLSGPRRSSPIPNKSGTLALYSEWAWSFTDHVRKVSWNILNITTGESIVLDTDPGGFAIWLGTDDTSVLRTNSTKEGTTQLYVIDNYKSPQRVLAGTVNGPVGSIRTATVKEGINLVFASRSYPNGTIYNVKKEIAPYSSGRAFDSLFVKHWDQVVSDKTLSLFSLRMFQNNGEFRISKPRNLLPAGSGLESPIPPFGGLGNFDLAPDGSEVVFVAKTPFLNPANNTQTLVYQVPFDGSREPEAINRPDDRDASGKMLPQGASTGPRYAPDGKSIAYLQMYENGYESDANKVFVRTSDSKIYPIAGEWDVSPASLVWTLDGRGVIVAAEHRGRVKLFQVILHNSKVSTLWQRSSVAGQGFYPLPKGKFLITASSLVSSAQTFLLDPIRSTIKVLTSKPEAQRALSSSQVEEFHFPGADDVPVHGFVIKPSSIRELDGSKYKLAFFIHGGPQGCWSDSWSFRWNPAVFAEHGYVVVAVNPTGSTGYGKKFQDAIKGQWGGKPYVDLENAIAHLEADPKYTYIDFDRMVALGASYGGFMVNYIQGMPLGRKFKALVCHDGVFSTLNQIASDEQYFPQHDFEGTLWDNREGYEQWNPARLIDNWSTPQLVIHSELDYRLPITEGLAAFNVLQGKGIPSKFLYFPDENHWVQRPENSLVWHREVFKWIDQWTGLDTEPIGLGGTKNFLGEL